jgi:hypothetical protein
MFKEIQTIKRKIKLIIEVSIEFYVGSQGMAKV